MHTAQSHLALTHTEELQLHLQEAYQRGGEDERTDKVDDGTDYQQRPYMLGIVYT